MCMCDFSYLIDNWDIFGDLWFVWELTIVFDLSGRIVYFTINYNIIIHNKDIRYHTCYIQQGSTNPDDIITWGVRPLSTWNKSLYNREQE